MRIIKSLTFIQGLNLKKKKIKNGETRLKRRKKEQNEQEEKEDEDDDDEEEELRCNIKVNLS